MSRYKAASIHLLISICVFSLFLCLVFFIWYISPYFHTQGVEKIIYIMAGVDVVLGPLLTLLLFKTGKKGLLMDLLIIAAVQVGALAYGGYTVYSERPVYIVFGHDKFEVVVKGEVDANKLPESIKRIGFFDQPIFVFQPRSVNPALDEMVFGFTAGTDGPNRLSALVEEYKSYDINIENVLMNAKKVADSPSLINEGHDQSLYYAIVTGKVRQVIALLHPDNATVTSFVYKSQLIDQ